MAKKPRIVDALSPLDAITQVTSRLILALLVLGGVYSIAGDGSMFAMDRQSICVDIGYFSSEDTPATDDLRPSGIPADMTIRQDMATVCDPDPGVVELALTGLTNAPTLFVFLGFVVATQLTIRYARQVGLFSRPLAARIERLGWLLLIGLFGAAVIEWLAAGHLNALLAGRPWHSGSFSISVAGIVGAYGIITVGRIMARAADLQDDVEGTV